MKKLILVLTLVAALLIGSANAQIAPVFGGAGARAAFSIPILESDSEVGIGQIKFTVELVDGSGIPFSGMAPQSGMPFPVAVNVKDLTLRVRVALFAEKLALEKDGRPKLKLLYSVGGNYMPARWDKQDGYVLDFDVASLGASMRTFSLWIEYKAGRAHSYVLGQSIPILSRMLTFSRDAGSAANSSFLLPMVYNEEPINGWEEYILWQQREASKIMRGVPGGAVGGIVPLRDSAKLERMMIASNNGQVAGGDISDADAPAPAVEQQMEGPVFPADANDNLPQPEATDWSKVYTSSFNRQNGKVCIKALEPMHIEVYYRLNGRGQVKAADLRPGGRPSMAEFPRELPYKVIISTQRGSQTLDSAALRRIGS